MNTQKIEIGEEYFLRVYVADIGENYLILETLRADGSTTLDEVIFCLPKTLANQLIHQ